ncbi:MAG: hypothetical protein U9R17_19145 [Thermodesulfobacteriota bacterium]|nr:hypothetical protein [Thermodesulfobacteriota bacterium]
MEKNNRERSEKSAIGDPDMLEETIKGRKNAFKIIGGRHLKIRYKPEDVILTVITAMVKGE